MRLKFYRATLVGMLFFAAAMLFSSCHHKQSSATAPIYRIQLHTEEEIQWWENKCACEVLCVLDGDSILRQGTVNFRGGTSSKFFKHSYTLKLDHADTFCGMPKNKSWILNASYIDKTFMRHKICYDLFRRMGSYNAAPQCRYALVYENEHPRGLYVVMQRLNKRALAIDKQDADACIFKEPKLFYPNMPPRDTANPNYHNQTFPEFDEDDKAYVLTQFREFILHASDEEFAVHVGEWIDLRNVVDWHLLLLFTNNGDGVLKNFYLYKKNAQTPFRIALWDCDHSFGRDGDNELNMLQVTIDDDRNILLNRLLKMPEYTHALSKRWRQLRDEGVISYEQLEKMVAHNKRYVLSGLEENVALWPTDSENYFDDNTFDQEVEILLNFVKISIESMDKRFR
ncbi:MAG: CotH kinase family protein [Bacteroidales bacterium]|nr:CotH kinase family protein [Bacteroidales bacterium]